MGGPLGLVTDDRSPSPASARRASLGEHRRHEAAITVAIEELTTPAEAVCDLVGAVLGAKLRQLVHGSWLSVPTRGARNHPAVEPRLE